MATREKYAPVVNRSAASPPPYDSYDQANYTQQHGSKWNPRNWSRWAIIGAIVAVIVIIVAVVVGAVVGTRTSSYPDYSPLTYSLTDTYSGANFFDNFDYFSGYDPTQGLVHYLNVEQSAQYNLTSASADSAVLKVDTTTPNATTGRFSVRITSKKQYDSGLFIFDILRTPYGCSTWPAIWLSDPSNWPYNGEIDVVEAVNQATSGNQMTLHTSDGCSMSSVKREETGSVLTTNCLNSTDNNAGCGVQGPSASFGAEFNAAGGGIYAMEWRSAGIRVWFFPRSQVPADIPTDPSDTSVTPDPSTWGTALADFPSTHCNIDSHFRNQSIIADIDLCGSWAGSESVYNTQDSCPGTCEQFVAMNQTAFETAVWEWASWRVYTAN